MDSLKCIHSNGFIQMDSFKWIHSNGFIQMDSLNEFIKMDSFSLLRFDWDEAELRVVRGTVFGPHFCFVLRSIVRFFHNSKTVLCTDQHFLSRNKNCSNLFSKMIVLSIKNIQQLKLPRLYKNSNKFFFSEKVQWP